MEDLVLFLDSDNVFELLATDGITGARFDGSVSVQVLGIYQLNSATPVSGQTWPMNLTYVTPGTFGIPAEQSPSGTYRGTVEYDIDVDRTKRYYAMLVFDGGVGKRRTVRYNVIFKEGQNP